MIGFPIFIPTLASATARTRRRSWCCGRWSWAALPLASAATPTPPMTRDTACPWRKRRNIRRRSAGDWNASADDYNRTVAQVRERTGCRIVGHFDLVTKFNEGDTLFSTRHPRYIRAVRQALDALAQADVTFEINTGAMARGYRSEPYPAREIMEELRRRGVKRILSSACRSRENLLDGFSEE